MSAAPYVALATVDARGRPAVRAMDAEAPGEDMVVWLATNPSSRKVRQIRAEPQVALYYLDADGPGYVTLVGSASQHKRHGTGRSHGLRSTRIGTRA